MKKIDEYYLENFWNKRVLSEINREKNNIYKKIHTDILWMEINSCIENNKNLNILDAGAGYGRFSIPLAEKGHFVLHLDVSEKMLDIAQKDAKEKKLLNIKFIKGSVDNLSKLDSKSFDIVLCFDSPISYCYNSYKKSISELIRVSKKYVLLCVMNRLQIIWEGGVNFDLFYFNKLKLVPEFFRNGIVNISEDLGNLKDLFYPRLHAFMPDEIIKIIEKKGGNVLKISAPGALSQFIDANLLKRLMKNKNYYNDYLTFEGIFDSCKYNLCLGSKGAGGLFIKIIK